MADLDLLTPRQRDIYKFIRSKIHWGAPFRYGFIKIPEFDFAQIAAAMGRNFDDDFPHVASASPALESEPVPA